MGSETELIARCRRGEPAAWDDLFDQHYDAAGRFVFQLATDLTREDVEEICQETFLSVIRNLNSFHGECRFQTWLFRVAANKARDFLEKRRAAKRGGGQITLSLDAEDPETGLHLDAPAPLPSPTDILISAERAALVHDALERLQEPCREIVALRYFGDLSYDELGAALKLNPKTVSSRLSKCLDRLEIVIRELFAKANPDASPSNL